MKTKHAISPQRSENYSEWYQQIIKKSELAEPSPTYGSMTIRPWGYAIWESIQKQLDQLFKNTGHENCYFPLLIPLSFLEKESQHVTGFATECAVVTHKRLVKENGKLIPASPLEEPLVIRPTSETIIGEAFSRWIQSYRDLPLLINQWANIVRWEMRPRVFLRTSEFLWQEGHTAHSTQDEAVIEVLKMLDVYAYFAEEIMAIPVIKGRKTESEKFPGADSTYCIEAMMQDRKALQSGTSHFLGQNFSKAFNIKFLSAEGIEEFAWTTSWGVSTRLIGGLVMVHGDDDGLIIPPRLAPIHVVIIPAVHKYEKPEEIIQYCNDLAKDLEKISYHSIQIKVKVDIKDDNPGNKNWNWIKKGVPVRLEIGPREFSANAVCYSLRDKSPKDKITISKEYFIKEICAILDTIQNNLLNRAKQFLELNSTRVNSLDELKEYFKNPNSGFAYAYWRENAELEAKLKQDFKITIRCIPIATENENGKCIFDDGDGQLAIFARAY